MLTVELLKMTKKTQEWSELDLNPLRCTERCSCSPPEPDVQSSGASLKSDSVMMFYLSLRPCFFFYL